MTSSQFTGRDLARLTLATQLQQLSEALRLAVAADDTEPDGADSLAGRIEALLRDDTERLKEALDGYRDAIRGAFVAPHVDDPESAAAAVDAWYVKHAQVEPLARVADPFTRLLSGRAPRTVPAWAGFPVPPGGHLVDTPLWRAGHGPTPYWPKGTVLIESKRHFVDYAEFTDDEAATLGPLVRWLTEPLRQATGAPRVHLFSCMEGTDHFHLWMVPRAPGATPGRSFIADPGYCTAAEAEGVIHELRLRLDATGYAPSVRARVR
jgi:diadenosine tetraphosphate (Ap4A) HIT family hydrolase